MRSHLGLKEGFLWPGHLCAHSRCFSIHTWKQRFVCEQINDWWTQVSLCSVRPGPTTTLLPSRLKERKLQNRDSRKEMIRILFRWSHHDLTLTSREVARRVWEAPSQGHWVLWAPLRASYLQLLPPWGKRKEENVYVHVRSKKDLWRYKNRKQPCLPLSGQSFGS